MWLPTNGRELLQVYGRMFVWKYGSACRIAFHIAAGVFIFWLLTFTW